ncbi:hypothetical protein RD792_017340 [Penstemon davidsonii]|uniref:RNase H type-1 domain-containing protein n=1 Tax=Penstemon davidsonii TaxID=160366 RepID=A0ABR0CN11_9LAMI|nr:hypothetical protein RD792_017340 [Penstemon davidsonii]
MTGSPTSTGTSRRVNQNRLTGANIFSPSINKRGNFGNNVTIPIDSVNPSNLNSQADLAAQNLLNSKVTDPYDYYQSNISSDPITYVPSSTLISQNPSLPHKPINSISILKSKSQFLNDKASSSYCPPHKREPNKNLESQSPSKSPPTNLNQALPFTNIPEPTTQSIPTIQAQQDSNMKIQTALPNQLTTNTSDPKPDSNTKNTPKLHHQQPRILTHTQASKNHITQINQSPNPPEFPQKFTNPPSFPRQPDNPISGQNTVKVKPPQPTIGPTKNTNTTPSSPTGKMPTTRTPLQPITNVFSAQNKVKGHQSTTFNSNPSPPIEKLSTTYNPLQPITSTTSAQVFNNTAHPTLKLKQPTINPMDKPQHNTHSITISDSPSKPKQNHTTPNPTKPKKIPRTQDNKITPVQNKDLQLNLIDIPLKAVKTEKDIMLVDRQAKRKWFEVGSDSQPISKGTSLVGSSGKPHDVLTFARDFCNRFRDANQRPKPTAHPRNFTRWAAPTEPFIKINFDAAIDRSNNSFGIGIIARNSCGTCIGWKASRMPYPFDSEAAEAYAAKSALNFGLDNGWNNIILEGDCKVVIEGIESSFSTSNIGPLLNEIQHLATRFVSFRAQHIFREGNQAAHALAKNPSHILRCRIRRRTTSRLFKCNGRRTCGRPAIACRRRICEKGGRNDEVLGALVEIDASFNKLTYLPTNIGFELVNLKRLSIHLNKIRSLPTSIGDMKSLTLLDVHFNELHGLPPSIGKLTNLEILNLSSNFSDMTELPETISDLTNLKELDLSNNQIHALPDTFGRLVNLTKLDVDQNPLAVPPKEVVAEGVEAVKAYMVKRWADILMEEEKRA